MAYRELSVVQIREILRLWLRGYGLRRIGRMTGVDRKTVRRYVEHASAAGLRRDADESALTDELVGAVVSLVQPGRPSCRGDTWSLCLKHRQQIQDWLDKQRLRLTKVHQLLKRQGLDIPYRTLHRFAVQELGFGQKQRQTLRVDDCEPGQELQIDFGYMGMVHDPQVNRKRKTWALIFTAVYSRHCFVWLTHRQRFDDVVEGFEQAWQFFDGVFEVVIPDNIKAIVKKVDPIDPVFTEGFIEYAQSRDFTIDPARAGQSQDKPRVERTVPYVRESFFKGERFRDLSDANERAKLWCLTTAGLRQHGTTHRQPRIVFETEEQPQLMPAPDQPYDVPLYTDAKVHRDQHIVVAKATYSMPALYLGKTVHVRADRHLVKVYHKRRLVKTHVRQPAGGRSSDPADFPEEKVIYATRDTEKLQQRAYEAGPAVGEYAEHLLSQPEPWRRMRAVYRLLGLVHRFGNSPVEQACQRALRHEVVDVKRIERMVRYGLEQEQDAKPPEPEARILKLRFARPASHFAVERPKPGDHHD